MKSALYEGVVRHSRLRPKKHAFSKRLFMTYLDLSELDSVFQGRWLWSTRRAALARFHREDHLGDPSQPLHQAVRELVEARSGIRTAGPVRILTHLRYFGYAFNPITLFYCFDEADHHIEAIVANVSNTPWNERYAYVLSQPTGVAGSERRYETAKAFHVSPFMGMQQRYTWAFGHPGEQLTVRIQNREGERRPLFHAELDLRRREITGANLARMLVRYPAMTAQVIAGIYGQALRLRRKGVPEHPHPREHASPGANQQVIAG